MKIGIYGGTFNPVHFGHIHILKDFISRLELERVILIPTAEPPHKKILNLAPAAKRAEMLELAAKQINTAEVLVSQIEILRKGKSYTADTLEELQKLYPNDELFLLMGEDMFLTVDKWYKPEIIFSLCTLCASPRSNDGLKKLQKFGTELEEKYNAKVLIEDISYIEVSSTEIRSRAEKGESISELVPDYIEEYIKKEKIYVGGEKE